MLYSSDYDVTYFSSMPVVEIEIKSEKNSAGATLRALVDSGADATIIPVSYLQQVQAPIDKRAWLRGVTGRPMLIDRYRVWLQFGGHRLMYLQVVGDTQGKEAILGRDVLNQFIVTLNGLASVVEISD